MKHTLLELLYEAMEKEKGLAVETTDPKGLRARLYRILKEEKLPLSLTIVADEVWILRKEIKSE